MTATFTCQRCKQVFEEDPEWSEADAAREYRDTFGHLPPDTKRVTVCADCFEAFARAFGRGRQRDFAGLGHRTPGGSTKH